MAKKDVDVVVSKTGKASTKVRGIAHQGHAHPVRLVVSVKGRRRFVCDCHKGAP